MSMSTAWVRCASYLDMVDFRIPVTDSLGPSVAERLMQNNGGPPILAVKHETLWCGAGPVSRRDIKLGRKSALPVIELQTAKNI